MIEKPGPKAWAAIRALAERPEPEALEVLVQLTHSCDPHIRRSPLEAIGIHPSGQTASEVICNAIHDRDGFVVRAAIGAAGNLFLEPAHEGVVSLLAASEESTRLAALCALGSLWRSSDFDPVRFVPRCSQGGGRYSLQERQRRPLEEGIYRLVKGSHTPTPYLGL